MAAPIAFLKQTYEELKKVVWPTRDDVMRLTVVVIAISLIVGLYVGGIDFILTKTVEIILK